VGFRRERGEPFGDGWPESDGLRIHGDGSWSVDRDFLRFARQENERCFIRMITAIFLAWFYWNKCSGKSFISK
jgi:hypothetical protein